MTSLVRAAGPLGSDDVRSLFSQVTQRPPITRLARADSGFVLRHELLSESVEFGSQVRRLEDFEDWREAGEFSDGCVGRRERDLHV